MSALEEIQNAIDKLTAERDASTQPTDGNSWIQGRDTRRYESSSEVFTGPDENTEGSADIVSYIEPEDARLIVTLHRTIDAQLAILTAASVDEYEWADEWARIGKPHLRGPAKIVPINRAALQLARAINGKDTK